MRLTVAKVCATHKVKWKWLAELSRSTPSFALSSASPGLRVYLDMCLCVCLEAIEHGRKTLVRFLFRPDI